MRIMAHISLAYKRARVFSVSAVSQQIVCGMYHSLLYCLFNITFVDRFSRLGEDFVFNYISPTALTSGFLI